MVDIHRDPLDLEQAHKVIGKIDNEKDGWSLSDFKGRVKFRPKSWKKTFNRYLPITDWLFNYKIKSDLMADIVAGITIAIMHIPQGMAYASLAETEAIIGIYTAVFPVLIYVLFGPSRHVSMGTNPLTSIIVGSIVLKYAASSNADGSSSPTTTTTTTLATPIARPAISAPDSLRAPDDSAGHLTFLSLSSSSSGADAAAETYTSVQILTALCLLSGLWQVLFAFLRFGKLSWLLSDVLVSGYTCGAAIHVVVSQLKGVFGIKLQPHNGSFKVINIVIELIQRLDETNWAAVIITAVCVIVLLVNNEIIKPRLAKKCSFPVPIQLIVVAAGTAISYFLKFEERYDVSVVGEMPTGLPQPVVPDKSLFVDLLFDSLIVAVVGYCITLSMAKIFANKFQYSVDGNQEMFAEGACNVFGSFFSSLPCGASMSRSSVQVAVGGKTQLTSIVSVAILIVVILFAGPLFAALPKSILSAVILVALKSMLFQAYDLPKYHANSRMDGLLWLLTFLATVILNIDTGLVVGIVLALVVFIYKSYDTKVHEVGPVENTGLFAEVSKSEFAVRPDQAVVLKLSGSVCFANFEDVLERIRRRLKTVSEQDKKCIILDFSNVSYVDQTGAKALKGWLGADKNAQRIIAGQTMRVERMLLNLDVRKDLLFPSLLDALTKKNSANGVRKASEHSPSKQLNGVTQLNSSNGGVSTVNGGGHVNAAFVEDEEDLGRVQNNKKRNTTTF